MKPLIILDIDETLIHTENVPDEYAAQYDYDFKFNGRGKSEFYTKKRPYLEQFLDYAFENFDVAIWTAAGEDYAKEIIRNIGILESSLNFFYTKDKCTIKLSLDYSDYYGVKNNPDTQELTEFNKRDMTIVFPDKGASPANPSGAPSLSARTPTRWAR